MSRQWTVWALLLCAPLLLAGKPKGPSAKERRALLKDPARLERVVRGKAKGSSKSSSNAKSKPARQRAKLTRESKRVEWRKHTVRPGENLSKIAKRLRCTTEELQKWNRLSKKKFIYPGQQLRYRRLVKPKKIAAKKKATEPKPPRATARADKEVARKVTAKPAKVPVRVAAKAAARDIDEDEPAPARREAAPAPVRAAAAPEKPPAKAPTLAAIIGNPQLAKAQRDARKSPDAKRAQPVQDPPTAKPESDDAVVPPVGQVDDEHDHGHDHDLPHDPAEAVAEEEPGDAEVGVDDAAEPDVVPGPPADEARPWVLSADETKAESIGGPGNGQLIDGVLVPRKGRGFRRINQDRIYGTDKTVKLIEYLGAQIADAFPGSQPLLVGAVSKQGGGRVRPHKSHQNGIDVDLAYFEKGNPKRKHYRSRVKADELDYKKNWFMVETMLLTGEVNYMFIDRTLMPGLRRAARKAGWPKQTLDKLFGDSEGKGRGRVLRHYGGHKYHVHVRFKCPKTDKKCKHSRYF